MRFNDTFLDDIRARLSVSQVVGKRVKLKRQGREFAGLSPFKDEKTPSFTVNDQKGFYHCFASGEHGDIFDFIMKTEGLSFPETVERLASEAGLQLPAQRPDMAEKEAKRKTLYDVMERAAAFFENQLEGSDGGQARTVLHERGVSREIATQFRLGYAPRGRHALKEFLAGEGIDQDQMVEAGLLIAGSDIPVSYDRFRHRIIFPITDLRGRVIAFGGRAMDPDQPAKYLNSPETPLFHKGSVLFNAATARQAAHDRGQLVVVEGYMDVIALAGAGLPFAVAPLGTALTPDQLKLLWRMVPEPVLCFDGDAAGIKAAHRAVDTTLPLLRPGHSLTFAFLPDGLDPDDLIRQEGAAAFEALLSAAKPMAAVLWAREQSAGQWNTPERRAALETRIEALVAEIGDPKVRTHYAAELNQRLERAWDARNPSMRKGGGKFGWQGQEARRGGPRSGRRQDPGSALAGHASESLLSSALVREATPRLQSREAVLLLTLLNHPWLLEPESEEIASIILSNARLEALRDAILGYALGQETLDSEALRTQLSRQGFGAIVATVERAITHKSDWFTQPEASREDVETGWRHVLALHRKSLELERELKAAERAYREEASDQAYERLCDIQRQLSNAEGTEASLEGYGVATDGSSSGRASVG